MCQTKMVMKKKKKTNFSGHFCHLPIHPSYVLVCQFSQKRNLAKTLLLRRLQLSRHSPGNFFPLSLLNSSMAASLLLNRVSRASSSTSLHLGFNSLFAQIHGGRISGTLFRGCPCDPSFRLSYCFLWETKKIQFCGIFHHRLSPFVLKQKFCWLPWFQI